MAHGDEPRPGDAHDLTRVPEVDRTTHPAPAGAPDRTRQVSASGRSYAVARVAPAVTYPLRARVLRSGAPPESAHLAVDDLADTAAFAATGPDGDVVGTAIVYPEPCRWAPERPRAWRLRGMATDERHRGTGVGAAVLGAVVDHVGAEGGALIWCNARVPARRFYERAGFVGHGEEWDDPDLGPHIAMWHELGPR
jgi:GNAT superfamily N-acetyltransferase